MNIKSNITEPISLEPPTEQELLLSAQLENYLQEANFFEDEQTAIQREKVLGKLDQLVKLFVQQVSTSLGLDKSGGAKIFTFGSYRLGVHAKGADIDTLCVAPKQITRKHFFNEFYNLLAVQENITNLLKIEDAYVPLIKFQFSGISIDLTFASLQLNQITDSINLLDNSILKNMDDKCILSVNGNRVTDEILSLVPNPEVFHKALRCIRYWARKRWVYGHVYGYFGGVAFAICVSKVCQLFPNGSSFLIVYKFFKMFAKYKWPAPILIKKIEQNELGFKIWDPLTNLSDKFHKMPVITPAYPSMCSTHNVFNSTQYYFTKEITRTLNVLDSAIQGNKNWLGDFYKKSDFFVQHKLFLGVFIFSNSDFEKIFGFVESKLRLLCTKLEENELITYSIPFPKHFLINSTELVKKYKLQQCDNIAVFFVALDTQGVKLMLNNKKINIANEVEEFYKLIEENRQNVAFRPLFKEDVGCLIRASVDV